MMTPSPGPTVGGARVLENVPLEPGDQGTAQTIERMVDLAHQGAAHPEIAWLAERLTHHPPWLRPQVLRDFLKGWLRFEPDPPNVELVRAPWVMIQERAGDCDDIATLAASLALAAGMQARFQTVGPYGGPFVHVFCQVRCCPSQPWRELDISRDVQGLPPDWTDWRMGWWRV